METQSRSIAGWVFMTLFSLLVMNGAARLSAQEPCSPGSQFEIPGVVKDASTQTAGAQGWKITQAQVSKIVSQAQGLIDLLLRLDYVAHPKGMQVGYYRAIGSPGPGTMTLEKQPYPLHVEAMFFSFGCINGKVDRRWAEADAGLSIEVNSLSEILHVLQSGYTAAQLEEPAVIPAQTNLHRTRLDSEDWGFVSPKVDLTEDCYPRCKFGQYLVTLNESYYDKSLPPTAFQLFVFTVGSTGYPKEMAPARNRVQDESLASFDFEALAAMLGK